MVSVIQELLCVIYLYYFYFLLKKDRILFYRCSDQGKVNLSLQIYLALNSNAIHQII